MESQPESRCGEIASDLSVMIVTVAQLVFFVFFHQYIAWYTTEPDGSVTRLSLLTDDYFTWLPFPITASILVIAALMVTIVFDRSGFRQIVWMIFSIIGMVVATSLVVIFPLDFSVLPNATAADVVPTVVRAFFILLAVFYGITALVTFVQLVRRHRAAQD